MKKNSDPGCGMKNSDPGSGINIPDPQQCTQVNSVKMEILVGSEQRFLFTKLKFVLTCLTAVLT